SAVTGKRSIVQWPEKTPRLAQLLKAAQLSIAHHKSLVQLDDDNGKSSPVGSILALPITLDGYPLLSIALSYSSTDPDYSRKIMQVLKNNIKALTQSFENSTSEEEAGKNKPPELEILTKLLATALAQDGYKAMATALTTELATTMQCDRVSLGYRNGNQTRLGGLSNSAEHKPRQSLVEALTAAMDEAIDQHATVEFPPPAGQTSAINLLHRQLAENHRGGAICTIPLFSNAEPVGALLLERPINRPLRHTEIELCENLASFLAPIIKMQHEISQPWLKRNYRALKHFLGKLFTRGDVLYKVIPLTIALVIGGMAAITVPFQLQAPAQVEGAVQRILSAPNDGFIKMVHVRPGDHVQKGQVLVELEDDALKLEYRKLEGEIAQLKSAYGTALASRDRAELSVAIAKIDEARARQALIQQQLKKVQLTAPFDALVIDGDLTQALGSPVNEGDKLLTLAPENDYRVILDIDERDIKYLQQKQLGKLTLAASPEDQFEIEIQQITPMAQVKDGHNVFPARAKLIDGPIALLRPGMEGVSKIRIADHSLLWTLARRSIDWAQFKLWVWTGKA
ncbi:MAG TPA: HlyD family efflux transporter periplasmic adaptor subunit, partial [Gammaproteobacteria bacterium]|nr:HlyD family efflux transporter periplasmic adaptor subunit [Gammaproteobacteria bacterium]